MISVLLLDNVSMSPWCKYHCGCVTIGSRVGLGSVGCKPFYQESEWGFAAAMA